jgi:hypothetical protein
VEHDFAARFAVDGGDEADAACVVFLVGRVGVVGFEVGGVRNEALDLSTTIVIPGVAKRRPGTQGIR